MNITIYIYILHIYIILSITIFHGFFLEIDSYLQFPLYYIIQLKRTVAHFQDFPGESQVDVPEMELS